jgi:hypothetical protein
LSIGCWRRRSIGCWRRRSIGSFGGVREDALHYLPNVICERGYFASPLVTAQEEIVNCCGSEPLLFGVALTLHSDVEWQVDLVQVASDICALLLVHAISE